MNAVRCSPSHSAALLVVDLDELAKATRVVVVCRLGIAKSLETPANHKKDQLSVRADILLLFLITQTSSCSQNINNVEQKIDVYPPLITL